MIRLSLALILWIVSAAAARGQEAVEHQAGDVVLQLGKVEHHGAVYEVQFGSLWVPMNRADPKSTPIELRFVRYPSFSPDPGPPLVYLAGGPGGSGISTMDSERSKAFLALLPDRDVIAFDQRGTGRSQPHRVRFDLEVETPLSAAGDPDFYLPQARQAFERMLAVMAERGIDVGGLTTEQSADDLDDLCAALGVEKLVLWGSSYGTHLGLTTARCHPQRVAALILAGTEGPDHTFKLPSNIQTNLESLAELARNDPVYAERMPDLVGTLESVLADLEANPVTVNLVPGVSVTVGKWDLQKVLSGAMGSRGAMQEIPARIYAMSHGNFFDLARWAAGFRQPGDVSAMSVVMDCASYATQPRLEQIEAEAGQAVLGAVIDFPMPCACDVPGMPRLGEAFRAPIHSDVPALFISGTLDGRTPVSNAQEIARGFANHQHLVIENAAHGGDLFVSSPKILESVKIFLRGESLPRATIAGPTWRFAPPIQQSLEQAMLEVLTTKGYEAAVVEYQRLRAEHAGGEMYDFDEAVLNSLGYAVMGNGNTDLAVDIFKLNTVGSPNSANAWDSLGEGHMNQGQDMQAIASYRRSLGLDPGNSNAERMLEILEAGGVEASNGEGGGP